MRFAISVPYENNRLRLGYREIALNIRGRREKGARVIYRLPGSRNLHVVLASTNNSDALAPNMGPLARLLR